ncbi:hypothetical protein MPER_13616, partial [Moniliophthora perniciosa FA553]
ANSFKILDHALNVLFKTPFTPSVWHNFAIRVDWENLTLQVFYSIDAGALVDVTGVVANPTVGKGRKGEFHIGELTLPLVNPTDSPADQ